MVGRALFSDKPLVLRSVIHTFSLPSRVFTRGSVLVSDQCKALAMATQLELLIKLLQAPSILQSRTNAPTRFSKRFTDPVLLGPDVSGDGVGEVLLRSLPPLPEAIHLCEVYQVHGKYL